MIYKWLKKVSLCGAILSLTIFFSVFAHAEKDLIDSVLSGCETELTTYCKDVTPRQKRVLACLYAYGDKLSAKCDYALFDAAVQLERAVAALAYVVNECADDLTQFCSEETVGEGRLLACLEKNEAEVSTRCKEAVKDVGLK